MYTTFLLLYPEQQKIKTSGLVDNVTTYYKNNPKTVKVIVGLFVVVGIVLLVLGLTGYLTRNNDAAAADVATTITSTSTTPVGSGIPPPPPAPPAPLQDKDDMLATFFSAGGGLGEDAPEGIVTCKLQLTLWRDIDNKQTCATPLLQFMCPATCTEILDTSFEPVESDDALKIFLEQTGQVSEFKSDITDCNSLKDDNSATSCNIANDGSFQSAPGNWFISAQLAHYFCPDQCPLHYTSITYSTYYANWPAEGKPAVQACGGQAETNCFVYATDSSKYYECSGYDCESISKPASGDNPIFFRQNDNARFVATDTLIYPVGQDIIRYFDNANLKITGASMPFSQNSKTYAIFTSDGYENKVFNLENGIDYSLMASDAPVSSFDYGHAAAVTDIGGDNNILAAVLYSKDSETHLGFYNWEPGDINHGSHAYIWQTHSLVVFSNAVSPGANNADVVFDSTNSYVLVTIGGVWNLVAVPGSGNEAFTTLPFNILEGSDNVKAAFAPPPPSGGGVRPPKLFVVARTSGIFFYMCQNQEPLQSLFFTPDGTFDGFVDNANFADFVLFDLEILGVEWSTPGEVIVYQKNSLQKVTVPDAVKLAYYGVETQTYESIYGDGAWPNEGVADFVSCIVALDNNVNDCVVWTANTDKCYATTCMFDYAQNYIQDIVGNIVAYYFHDGMQLIVGSDNFIALVERQDSSTNMLADDNNNNDVIITGASDWWQDSANDPYYAIITTTTDVAIYDLQNGDKTLIHEGVKGYAAAAVTNGDDTTIAAALFSRTRSAQDGNDGNHYIHLKKINQNDAEFPFSTLATNYNTGTLTFDTTGNYLLATLDNEWMLVSSADNNGGADRILRQNIASSNVQVAFSPSPNTFTTASGGGVPNNIFKQLYVVATKNKLEWYSVDNRQLTQVLATIEGLNVANDELVSVEWLTQHEVVLFRSTSGRQHVPVPGKVFNVDRNDIIDSSPFMDSSTCADSFSLDSGCTNMQTFICPVTCSLNSELQVHVDQYLNQNQILQAKLQERTDFDSRGYVKSVDSTCTTIDCNIFIPGHLYIPPDQLETLLYGAHVAQLLCPETCKAPLPENEWSTVPYIRVSGACDGAGINGIYSFLASGIYKKEANIDVPQIDVFITIHDNQVNYQITTDFAAGSGSISDVAGLPMGTRTWQVDCDLDSNTLRTSEQVTIEAIPPPPPPPPSPP